VVDRLIGWCRLPTARQGWAQPLGTANPGRHIPEGPDTCARYRRPHPPSLCCLLAGRTSLHWANPTKLARRGGARLANGYCMPTRDDDGPYECAFLLLRARTTALIVRRATMTTN
jgi:hypothetical protein